MSVCSSPHSFRSLYCSSCGYVLSVPIYCRNRFCPTCSADRTAKIRERLRLYLRSLNSPPGYSVKFLTLTIPPQDSPRESARVLVSSFRRLRKRSFWRSHVSGGAFVLEASFRNPGFHIHIHAVVDAKYMDYNLLLAEWMAVSPGRGVYIRRIPHNAAVNYLTKYLTKSTLPEAVQPELSSALKDFRLFQLFGLWHGNLPALKRRRYNCPECGNLCWLPDYVIDAAFRQMHNAARGLSRQRSPT